MALDWFKRHFGQRSEADEFLRLRFRPVSAFLPLRAVIILLMPLLLWLSHLSVRSVSILWGIFALALISLPGSYLLDRRGLLEQRGFRWALPLVDLLLAVLLHQGCSGQVGAFFPLFYVPIVYSGLLAGYWGGLISALGAAIAYGFVYLLNLPPGQGWVVLSPILLFPVAGLVSGYIGRRLDQLNQVGKHLLEEAQALQLQVENRREIYERWYRAVDRLKADFVYSVSHELRTPLTPVKGYLQLLTSAGTNFSPEKQQEYLQIVSNNVDLLAQLVDDVIYLQRITRISIDLEEVTLAQVARQALDEVVTEAEESDIQLQLDEVEQLPTVLGSADSLKLVMINLLESLIADSPTGSQVELALKPLDGGVELRISGEGRGIPVEHQERIFDLFFHADSSPTYVLGREGLSLAIARYIIEMHGGRISVENQPRGGMAFVISLPRQISVSPASAEESA